MRKKTVTVTWTDGKQETYTTYGAVSMDKSGTLLRIASEAYERDLPGGTVQQIPLGNVRIFTIKSD